MQPTCPLCLTANPEVIFTDGEKSYYGCGVCHLRFLDRRFWLRPEAQKARYETHRNNRDNPGYVEFLAPLVQAVSARVAAGAKGLDFGCGPTFVLRDLLREAGFDVESYDPFFANEPWLLENCYDFIVASEVAEHFEDPHSEFQRLAGALERQTGQLFVMTAMLEPGGDFATWYYRRDPTHVAFYCRETFLWIAQNFNFSLQILTPRIALLSHG